MRSGDSSESFLILLIRNQENLGLQLSHWTHTHAESRYLCLVNSDVEILSTRVWKKMIQFAGQRPDIELAGPRIHPDGGLQPSCRFFLRFGTTCVRRFGCTGFSPAPLSFSRTIYLRSGVMTAFVMWMSCGGASGWLEESPGEQLEVWTSLFMLWKISIGCERFHLRGWRVVYPEASHPLQSQLCKCSPPFLS